MKTVILTEELNDGFILTINGKTKAVETLTRVREIISEQTKNCTDRLTAPSVRRSMLTIEFEENPPVIQ